MEEKLEFVWLFHRSRKTDYWAKYYILHFHRVNAVVLLTIIRFLIHSFADQHTNTYIHLCVPGTCRIISVLISDIRYLVSYHPAPVIFACGFLQCIWKKEESSVTLSKHFPLSATKPSLVCAATGSHNHAHSKEMSALTLISISTVRKGCLSGEYPLEFLPQQLLFVFKQNTGHFKKKVLICREFVNRMWFGTILTVAVFHSCSSFVYFLQFVYLLFACGWLFCKRFCEDSVPSKEDRKTFK